METLGLGKLSPGKGAPIPEQQIKAIVEYTSATALARKLQMWLTSNPLSKAGANGYVAVPVRGYPANVTLLTITLDSRSRFEL
jgi:hypothetical protein